MKLCKDCRHFEPDKYTTLDGKCCHPDVVWMHPIDGRKLGADAFSTRVGLKARCGIDAVLWEPIPAAPFEAEEVKDEHLL